MTTTEPDDDNEPIKRGQSATGRIEAPATSADNGPPHHTPDLDQRERGQSAKRKAAGPGGPTRPAPRPSSVDRDEEPEAWGTDPAEMPSTEPTDPS